jgi:DNA-binding CsgD family transcriptional regulator
MLLTLSERDQSQVHRLLMARPEPGHDLLPPDVVDALALLVRCDLVEVRELDRAGRRLDGFDRLPRGCSPLGHDHRMVRLAFVTPRDTVVTLSLRRHQEPFTDRDVRLLQMVEPVLAGLLRGRARLGCDGQLSESEHRVLELVASGASNAEVAEQLSVSVSTVRKHLEHSYRKLGVTNRTAAVAALREDRPPTLPDQRQGSRIG